MPPQHRVRADTEDLRPATPGNQPGQRSQPHPVGGFVPHLFDLAAQHSVLMAKNQQFHVLGYVAAHEHRGDFEYEPRDHVSQRQRHHPARLPASTTTPQQNPQVSGPTLYSSGTGTHSQGFGTYEGDETEQSMTGTGGVVKS